METQSLTQNIKQEPDYETDTNMETQSLIQSGELKHEPDYEVQTGKKEVNGKEESYMFLVMKRSSTSSPSLSCPDEDSFLYCEKCQLKYEGGCPEHGPVICVANAEKGKYEGKNQESSPQVVDNKDRQVLGKEKVEQSKLYVAHSNDVGTLAIGGCSTESDEMFSVCEMNTELCVASTSCGFKTNVEIKACHYIHNSVKHFNCDVCGVGFVQSRALQTHMRKHTGEKPYKCDVCGLGCTQQGSLKSHIRTHTGEKPYKCDVCGAGFTEQSSLKKHKRIHTKEKPYKCDACGLGFTQQGSLKSHMRTHTGEKPYKCDVCGTGFTEQSSLKKHKRIHTKEKPYKCDVCGFGFTQRGSLKCHMRIHTGEKPYKCDVCGKGFTDQGNLKKHNRTHTGEKPYKCDLCGTGFTQSISLMSHKRTHVSVIVEAIPTSV